MNEDAERLYSRVFNALTTQWQATNTFRNLARLGLPLAQQETARENELLALRLLQGKEFDKLFIDKKGFFEFTGGWRGMAKSMTEQQLATFQSAIDAASIVFMHSALDAAVSDFCDVCALAGPGDWEQWIGDRRVKLSKTKGDSYETLRASELAAHVAALKRDSMLKRVDTLFALCTPTTLDLIKGYSFDRERLDRVDKLRQRIIHGEGVKAKVEDVEATIEFLAKTGIFLLALVNQKYSVQINAAYAWDLPPKQRQTPG